MNDKMLVALSGKCEGEFNYDELNFLVGGTIYPDEKNFEICQIFSGDTKLYEVHYQLNAQKFLYIEAVTGKGFDITTLFAGVELLKRRLNARGIIFVTKLAGLAKQAQNFGFEIMGLYLMKKNEHESQRNEH